MVSYIENQKQYVLLTDTAKLPASIKPWYHTISTYLLKGGKQPADYYVWTTYIVNGKETLSIALCHYDGFVLQKTIDEKDAERNKNRKPGEPLTVTDINGNTSGKDGNLEINKTKKQVEGFSLWQ